MKGGLELRFHLVALSEDLFVSFLYAFVLNISISYILHCFTRELTSQHNIINHVITEPTNGIPPGSMNLMHKYVN